MTKIATGFSRMKKTGFYPGNYLNVEAIQTEKLHSTVYDYAAILQFRVKTCQGSWLKYQSSRKGKEEHKLIKKIMILTSKLALTLPSLFQR